MSLPAFEYKTLSEKGIDTNTINVISLDGHTVYSISTDYDIQNAPTVFDHVSIARSANSTITDGQTVLISYMYGESLTVTYNVNSLVNTIQNNINNEKKCLTADVLVKEANQINIDLEFTVALNPGVDEPFTKDQLSTDLYNLFDQKKLGQRINQSDVVRIIDNNDNINYVVLPLIKLAISDGTHIAYEALPSSTAWMVYQTVTMTSYRTSPGALKYSTGGSSSDPTLFWRVSEDDYVLQIVATQDEVALGSGRAYIASDGSVYISTLVDDIPSNHTITVAYNVLGESGSNDIIITDLDYTNLNSLIIHTI